MKEALQKMRESQRDPKDNIKPPNHINQDLRDNHIKTVPTYPSLYCNATAFMVKVTQVYAMTQADPDTLMLKEAMAQPDVDKFPEAMIKEI